MVTLVVVEDSFEKTTPEDESRDPNLTLEEILAEFEIDPSKYDVDIGDKKFGDNEINGSTTLGDIAKDDNLVSIYATPKNKSSGNNEADDDGEEDGPKVHVHIRNKEGIKCKTDDDPFPPSYTLDDVFNILGIDMDINEHNFLVNNRYFRAGRLNGEEKLDDLKDEYNNVVVVSQSVFDMEDPNNPRINLIEPDGSGGTIVIGPQKTSSRYAGEIHIRKRQKTHR